jgi:hypothetical protein
MLFDFEYPFRTALAWHVEFHGQRVVNGGRLAGKFHIHDRSDDLNDFAFVHAID